MSESEKIKYTKLTDQQEKFCYEYVLHLNATKAAKNAGYSEKTAYSIGQRLLKIVEIQNRISQMKDNLAETAGISALRIAQEHSKIAFSSIAHLHNTWIDKKNFEELSEEQKACIKNISTKIVRKEIGEEMFEELEFVKIELWDKQKSLDSLSKMLGFDGVSKIDVTSKGEKIDNTVVVKVIRSKDDLNEHKQSNPDNNAG